MQLSENINGYVVLGVDGKASSNKDAGFCVWTFAFKDGIEYFMKEFLAPKYPDHGCPLSLELQNKMKAECEEFQRRHLALKDLIDRNVPRGSSLVHTLDFFRRGSKYYKVSAKVEHADITLEEIADLDIEKRIALIKSLAEALEILHKLRIIHGDLKTENVLLRSTDYLNFHARLIDYDNSYFEGNPPSEKKSIVGDLAYYSPELENYISGAVTDKSQLTTKSDIFALGLLFCQYLTGEFPQGIAIGRYASSVVNNGSIITINPKTRLPSEIVRLVNSMLLKNPASRPNIGQIIATLNNGGKNTIVQLGGLKINPGKRSV